MSDLRPVGNVKKIAQLYSGAFGLLTGLSVLSLIGGLLEASFLALVARTALGIADRDSRVVVGTLECSIATALLIATLLLGVRLTTSLLAARANSEIFYRLVEKVRVRLASAYFSSTWESRQAEAAGTLQQLLVTFPLQIGAMVSTVSSSTAALGTLLAMFATAIFINTIGTVVVFAVLIVISLLLRPLQSQIGSRSEQMASSQLEFANETSRLNEMLLEVQTFGVSRQVLNRLNDSIRHFGRSHSRQFFMASSTSPLYITLAYFSIVLALAAGQRVSTSFAQSMALVMIIMLRSLGYGQTIQSGFVAISTYMPALDLLSEATSKYVKSVRTGIGEHQNLQSTKIVVEDVSFSYEGNRPDLEDLTFEIEAGEIVGIAGASGSGKSTLLHLLLGLRSVSRGSIAIGGVGLESLDEENRSQLFAFVPQKPSLMAGTVENNVRFFRSKVSDEEIQSALERVGLSEFVSQLPNGIWTELGERGFKLSGGQQQRIAIARALAGGPSILVMDEPTSSLDSVSEGEIRNLIDSLRGSMTVIVVAHKFTTLDVCDRVIVMDSGHITRIVSRADFNESWHVSETL